MKLKVNSKKRTAVLIILMSISLIGIILVQLFWIRNAIDVKEKQFDQNVNKALSNIVGKLETGDALDYINDQFVDIKADMFLDVYSDSGLLLIYDSLKNSFKINISDSILENIMIFSKDSILHNIGGNMIISENEGKFDLDRIIKISSEFNSDSFKNAFKFESKLIHQNKKIDSIVKKIKQKTKVVKHRIKKFDKVINKIAFEYAFEDTPITERIDFASINKIIEKELINKDLPAQYEFGISEEKDTFYIKSEGFSEENINYKYKTNLFPEDIYNSKNYLFVYFPDKKTHLYKSIILLLGFSGFFTLIIIITFAITLYIIQKQKKISEIKSDFMNNMTHEFKTPIATISLAVDSINNPKVIKDRGNIKYYTEIIKEENRRMNSQVENILQMSLVEKNDLELNIKKSNIHFLINKAIKNISLQIEKNNGKIISVLDAENYFCKVDEIHFTNILYNLLDNANKYCERTPEIVVSTRNTETGIIISVKDNGIGMNRGTQSKIFEKFFRVSKGNIHNVKGFGLGLSYVKAMVNSFHGTINLKSEIGKGSLFEIYLPNIKER
ncbi:MAG: HAMP domain-containing histidine kinase [Bacteroidales bacterium]|nr:HAMP domain-containing histidine kinase [Bacteroidales bacterium]